MPELASSGKWCTLQKIVTTDGNGHFDIPSVAKELETSELRFNALSLNKLSSRWLLIAYKPGYVRASDRTISSSSNDRLIFNWEIQPPETYRSARGEIGIKPIAMRKMDLQAADFWSYYSSTLSAAGYDAHGKSLNQPEMQVMFDELGAKVRPMPCAMAPQQPISLNMLMSI